MSGIKILLVDDREDNLLSIETILASDGYEFIKANSGRQALKILLKDQNFNLVLMDVKMPGLSGFETASLIYERDKLKHIPIIFITAYSYSDDKVYEGYKTGAVDYIYKPINPQLLKAKVAVFIDLYKKTHQLMIQEQSLKSINKDLADEIRVRKFSENQVNQLNIQLIENIENLENANTELARFAYVASHDLQEPLRKIRTYGDLLKNKYTSVIDEEGQYYINRIQKGAERLQNLIKDILSYSRLTIDSASLVKSDLNIIIQEILVDLEMIIEETNAKINICELPDLYVNPGQIRQLFQNIIGNALKFLRPNTDPEINITYDISSKMVQTEDKANVVPQLYCNIYIKDNGIGFDDSYSEQIFTLFKRLNDSAVFEGTGIGLAICKKIVEQHKGFISAKGKLNEGSIFTISLPINQTPYEINAQKSNTENSYSRR
ncbi:MAG: response regulator [Bacteroidetes bacterium]|nr:response regulator [Bacteroidota bacterium]